MEIFEYLGELHGLLVFTTALLILYTDHKGFQYFTGRTATMSRSFIQRSHRMIWIGLLSIIVTGASLFSQSWEYRLGDPVFILKMGFVAILLWNAVAIGKLGEQASVTPFKQLDQETQRTLLVSGGLSVIGWVSAFVIGFWFL